MSDVSPIVRPSQGPDLREGGLGYVMPWTWDTSIDHWNRKDAVDRDLYSSNDNLRAYDKSLWSVMQERPVIYPDMVQHHREAIFRDSDQPITVEEYVARKADLLAEQYGSMGIQVDPRQLYSDVHDVLSGRPYDENSMGYQYAMDVLNTLQRGSASFQHPTDLAVDEAQFEQMQKSLAGGGRWSPDHGVPPETQRYFRTQGVYDFLRAMQDGQHAPPYASTASNIAAAVGTPFDWTGGSATMWTNMGFGNRHAGRAGAANYWLDQADTALPPEQISAIGPDRYGRVDPFGSTPGREQDRANAAATVRQMSVRDAGGTSPLPGGNAMYPHWSTSNMTGAFGDGTYGGANFGADHPYGVHNQQWYRNFAEFSRSPLIGLTDPTQTHARGVMYPAQTDADMDRYMNRILPVVPSGMTREQFADFYQWRQGDENQGEAYAGTTYPELQAALGTPPEQRTWGPQWYTTLQKVPQNTVGDLSFVGMTAGTAGYGGLAGGGRALAANLGKAGAGALAARTGGGALKGLGRGTMAATLDAATDVPSDYATEQGIGYGLSGSPSFISFFTQAPEQNDLLPDYKPTSGIRDLVRSRNEAMGQRENEYRLRLDEWNLMRGRPIPAEQQRRWHQPQWYRDPNGSYLPD